MALKFQSIRGMNDVLPVQSGAWQKLETIFSTCLRTYGYQEIRLPFLESTELFKRTIGEVTDIVEKEMYTFTDLNGDSISLRPEGTAGCVRACLEHGLLRQQQKLWYRGPMFRHEKPQRGRYRQFTQLGVEAFGIPGVGIEIELILMCQRLWHALGISDALQLQINTLGTLEERQLYRQKLIEYFTAHFSVLDHESQQRLHRSPMRILDSKNSAMQSLIEQAPSLFDTLGDESRQHFHDLCRGLEAVGVSYTVNPVLVRGLDYYGHTVFEWVTDQLGAQSTVCAGGRYDKLIEQLGGHETPAVGFALGAERLLLLQDAVLGEHVASSPPHVFFVVDSDEARYRAFVLADQLREHLGLDVWVYTGDARMKAQFKKADQSGAQYALVLGENELVTQTVVVKNLRSNSEQQTISQADLISDMSRREVCQSI